jgi:signal transduction histidine kinase
MNALPNRFKLVQHFALISLAACGLIAVLVASIPLWLPDAPGLVSRLATAEGGFRLQLAVLAIGLLALCAIHLSLVRRAQTLIEWQAAKLYVQQGHPLHMDTPGPFGELVAGATRHLNTPLTRSKDHALLAIRALEEMLPGIEAASRQLAGPSPPEGARAALPLASIPGEIRAVQEILNDVLLGIDQVHGLVDELRMLSRPDPRHARGARGAV